MSQLLILYHKLKKKKVNLLKDYSIGIFSTFKLVLTIFNKNNQ